MDNLENIEKFLEEMGWDYEMGEDGILSTGFKVDIEGSPDLGFPLYIMKVKDPYEVSYYRFSVVPFIDPGENGYAPSLIESSCRINHNLNLLKFAIDGNNKLELILDVPDQQMNQTVFQGAITALSDASVVFYPTLSED